MVEAWEGTHNELCAQVLRDLHKLRLHAPFLDHLGRWAQAGLGVSEETVESLSNDLIALLTADADTQTLGMRPLVDRMMAAWQEGALAEILAG